MELMNRKHQGSVISSMILVLLLILCAVVINTTAFTQVQGEEKEREVVPISKPSLWEVLKNGFSVYSSSPMKVTSYWEKLKLLMHQLHAYFIPPNLDFRGSGSARSTVEEPSKHGVGVGGGAGEAVKDAVSKSFGSGKETVEDTAKSAARVVDEAVQKTKEKVKRSFSDQEGHQPHEPEL